VPVLQDGDFPLFESGAILFHLGEKSPLLMPTDPAQRSQTVMWMFAALNSVEPHIGNLAELLGFSAGEAWALERRPALEKKALSRLHDLDAWLVGKDYLVGRFTVADILMTTVLRLLDDTDLVHRYPALSAYKERCISRPAFKKALADHTALYAKAA
jgi:glutathione S-transferase